GTCGNPCPANSTCNAAQNSCDCANGYFPNKDLTACILMGGSCAAMGSPSYCVGSNWAFCDPYYGMQVWSCSPGTCATVSATSAGCTCGSAGTTFPSLNQYGYCATITAPGYTPYANEYSYTCYGGVTYVSNCRAQTGQSTGRCWTLVTSFGYQSMCHCNQCTQWNPSNNTCSPACPGMNCSILSSNSYTCN
ncbi:MAG: hypothetical protein ACYC8T_30515, partial [Myxococcaceae bacterium]